MTGSPRSGAEFMPTPNHSRSSQTARWIEHTCAIFLQISLVLLTIFGTLFVGYLIVGTLAFTMGVWTPPYHFLSVETDPFSTPLIFASGLVLCSGMVSLITLHLMYGVEKIKNMISLLAAFTGLGLGATLIRLTVGAISEMVI